MHERPSIIIAMRSAIEFESRPSGRLSDVDLFKAAICTIDDEVINKNGSIGCLICIWLAFQCILFREAGVTDAGLNVENSM